MNNDSPKSSTGASTPSDRTPSKAEADTERKVAGYKIHPLALAFPAMSEKELAALTDDICAIGQQQSAVVYEEMILAARSPTAARERAGKPLRAMPLPENVSPLRLSGMRLFHYTVLIRWREIQADKVILPATILVPQDEKPTVWFSFRRDWEPTASPAFIKKGKRKTATFDEIVESKLVPCRIEVSPEIAPMNWREWQKLSGVKSKIVKGLEEAAIEMGANVNDWRMTFDAVESGDWLAVEGYLSGAWRSITHKSTT